MQLRAFGRLCAVDGDGAEVPLGRPKQRLVLALLLVEGGRTIPTSRLVELLWHEDGDKERAALQAYISNLRRALGPTAIVRDGLGYRLEFARDDVDVWQFEDLVATGLRTGGIADDDRVAVLGRVVDLWSEPPLREFDEHRVVAAAQARWRSLLGRAFDEWSRMLLADGGESVVIAELESHIADFPLDERLAVHLATAQYRVGRQADALRTLSTVRRSLMEASGLDVGAEVRSLEQRILVQAPELDGPAAPTTAPAAASITSTLIGRDPERTKLAAAMAAAAAGRGGVLGVVAEAGAGKSTLVAHLENTTGSLVGSVRCPEGVAMPPFWPLRQLTAAFGEDAFPVEVLLAEGTTEPFLLAARLADALGRAPAARLMVVDDLQWADLDTISVVAHLVAALRSTTTLLVLTCRPLSDDSPVALVACLSELTRHGDQLYLGALTLEDVVEWLRQRTRRIDVERLAADVYRRTEGNALFVREVIELLAADDDLANSLAAGDTTRLDRIPPGVGAIVRRRLGALPPSTQRLLSVAAVIGAEFELDLVAEVLELAAGAALGIVEPALQHGIVHTDAQHGFRFSHSLVADALATEVNSARAAEIHAATARTLWRRSSDAAHAARVARHAAAGVLAGSAMLGADASELAAEHAAARSAPADAAGHWLVAAEMVRIGDPGDVPRRTAALRRCGAAWQRVDRVRDAQRAIVAALSLSRDAGQIDDAARAASLLNHASIFPNQPYGTVDVELVMTLTSLLDVMPSTDSSARALVMSALATELFHSPDATRRDRLSLDAIDMARRVDDAHAMARALHARTFALKAPGAVPARRDVADELRQLVADERFGADLELVAELQVALADFALGEFESAGSGVERCVPLLDRPVGDALRSQLGFFRSHLDFVQGRHEDALRQADDALQLYRLDRPEDADVFVLAQHCMFRHDLGGLDVGLLTSLPATPGVQGYAQAFQWWTTALLFDIGRTDLAEPRLATLGDPVPQRPADYLTLFIDVAAGMCAAAHGDHHAAALLAERLRPWKGRWASAGTAAGSLGLVDLTLARLDDLLGRHEEARQGFVDAVAGHERLATPAWLARTLIHTGWFHQRAGNGTDAAASWARARSVASAAGLTAIVAQVPADPR